MPKLVFVLNVPDRFSPPPRYHVGPPMPTEHEALEELRRRKLAGWYVEDDSHRKPGRDGQREIGQD